MRLTRRPWWKPATSCRPMWSGGKPTFEPTFDPSAEYSQMLCELTQDPARNALIADDVAQEARGNGGGVCLVLS